jgi:hypothetical protein
MIDVGAKLANHTMLCALHTSRLIPETINALVDDHDFMNYPVLPTGV